MAKKATGPVKYDVSSHVLVPKHIKLDEKEKQEVLDTYKITVKELPRILITDPAIQHLNPKLGDVIRIERMNKIKGMTYFYRGVINEL